MYWRTSRRTNCRPSQYRAGGCTAPAAESGIMVLYGGYLSTVETPRHAPDIAGNRISVEVVLYIRGVQPATLPDCRPLAGGFPSASGSQRKHFKSACRILPPHCSLVRLQPSSHADTTPSEDCSSHTPRNTLLPAFKCYVVHTFSSFPIPGARSFFSPHHRPILRRAQTCPSGRSSADPWSLQVLALAVRDGEKLNALSGHGLVGEKGRQSLQKLAGSRDDVWCAKRIIF